MFYFSGTGVEVAGASPETLVKLENGVLHTFATLALQNGVDVKTVPGMLGHFSAGFTLDTYARITSAAQGQAAQIMGSVLAGTIRG